MVKSCEPMNHFATHPDPAPVNSLVGRDNSATPKLATATSRECGTETQALVPKKKHQLDGVFLGHSLRDPAYRTSKTRQKVKRYSYWGKFQGVLYMPIGHPQFVANQHECQSWRETCCSFAPVCPQNSNTQRVPFLRNKGSIEKQTCNPDRV